MPEYQYATVDIDDHLMIVTINRPDRMNAVHPPANLELGEIFDRFAENDDLWVAILTGSGERAFCAGNDLRYQSEGGEWFDAPRGFGGLTHRFDLNKPVIAAVNGVAMGGGFEIALACDLILAADTARFALPEPKVGLAAIAGGLMRLPREIGLKRAMSLILTGRHVDAREGLELGFVNAVVPAKDLMVTAREWASAILACSPMSIRASKEMVRNGLDVPGVQEAFAQAYPATEAMLQSEDMIEGPRAFVEKRAPHWKGK